MVAGAAADMGELPPLARRELAILPPLRTAPMLAGFALLGVEVRYVVAARLTVLPDYAAVSGPSHVLRAPQPGFVRGADLAARRRPQIGQAFGALHPLVTPQARADAAEKPQRRAALDASRHGFENDRKLAQSNLDAATRERSSLEEIVAAQRRNLACGRQAAPTWLWRRGRIHPYTPCVQAARQPRGRGRVRPGSSREVPCVR